MSRWSLPLATTALTVWSCCSATSPAMMNLPPVPISTLNQLSQDVVWHDDLGLVYSLSIDSFYLTSHQASVAGVLHVDNPSSAMHQLRFPKPEPLELRLYDALAHEFCRRTVTIYPAGGVVNFSSGDHHDLPFVLEVQGTQPEHTKLGIYTVVARIARADESWLSARVDTDIPVERREHCPGRRVSQPVLPELLEGNK